MRLKLKKRRSIEHCRNSWEEGPVFASGFRESSRLAVRMTKCAQFKLGWPSSTQPQSSPFVPVLLE
jgi:hypothetical protein